MLGSARGVGWGQLSWEGGQEPAPARPYKSSEFGFYLEEPEGLRERVLYGRPCLVCSPACQPCCFVIRLQGRGGGACTPPCDSPGRRGRNGQY